MTRLGYDRGSWVCFPWGGGGGRHGKGDLASLRAQRGAPVWELQWAPKDTVSSCVPRGYGLEQTEGTQQGHARARARAQTYLTPKAALWPMVLY